ncbi:MAG: CHAP domain-containing protein [Rhodoglobus sp.]|nr:CHAP domain-containing protein [Rhodoglobus sp.]
MVEQTPSGNPDAQFTLRVPQISVQSDTPVQQYQSRREFRDALASTPVVAAAPTARSAQVVAVAPRSRKLKGSEMRALRASASRAKQKNPIIVLATMTVVGGMFAVAGLPAYALQSSEFATAKVDLGLAQTLVVSAAATAEAPVRDGYRATTPEALALMDRDAQRAANQAVYLASGARELGDDYPWYYELRDYQGGGLSPLNYYYRECVDFVAWRLNRDAGSYEAPFKWVWSNLTPNGGNASQWMYNWQQKGWPVSQTPIVGSVAYTGANHIAYVKSVNGDGTVTIEEYNWYPGIYSQRVIAASSVVAFLYPPN